MKNSFFITGLYRSGTTLIDKILHAHPALLVGSQPFPLLYYALKQHFLDEKQIEKRYPIDPLFMEKSYQIGEFEKFLNRFSLSKPSLLKIFQAMVDYNGVLTEGFPEYCLKHENLEVLHNKAFIEVFDQLLIRLAQFLGECDYSMLGTKEIICEEYIPWLLSHDKKVIHIVRDPRDTLASLSTGNGRQFMGALRPTLYTVRMWRKSVAFAIEHSMHENYFMLRYEDFVQDPLDKLKQLTDFLSIEAFDPTQFTNGIRDQTGQLWKGNSSFDPYQFISTKSIGKYKTQLKADTIRYIETLCYPELRWMGYDLSQERTEQSVTPDAIKLEEEVEDERFSKTYSVDPENMQAEAARLEKLSQSLSKDEAIYWFIFRKAHRELSQFV